MLPKSKCAFVILTTMLLLVAVLGFVRNTHAQDNMTCGELRTGKGKFPLFVPYNLDEAWFILTTDHPDLTQDFPSHWDGRYIRIANPVFGVNAFAEFGYPMVRDLMEFAYWEEVSSCEPPPQPITQPSINFWADRTEINQGECVRINWDTANVQAVYYENQGVVGVSSVDVCPSQSSTYRLKVITNSSEIYKEVMINVNVPITQDTDNAALVAQGDYTIIAPGAKVVIWMDVRNTGTSTWDPNEDYTYLGTGLWEGRNNRLWKVVPPNSILNFGEEVTAPTTPGKYTYGFILIHAGQTFGPHFFIEVTVAEPEQPAPVQPTPSSQPPASQTVEIELGRGINLRYGPGTNYNPPIRATSQNRERFLVTGQYGWPPNRWLQLDDPVSGKTVWIAASVVSFKVVSGNIKSVPYVDAPNVAVQVRLKISDSHYQFLQASISGYDQNGQEKQYPPYICPNPGAAIATWCKTTLHTKGWWWRDSMTISFEVVPVIATMKGEPQKGSCEVQLPSKYWTSSDVTVVIDSQNLQCSIQ